MPRSAFLVGLLLFSTSGPARGERIEFDEKLLRGDPAQVPRTPREGVRVHVAADASPEQLMQQAEKLVREANSAGAGGGQKLRGEAAALFRSAQARFDKQQRPDMALLAEAHALRQDGDFEAMVQTFGSLLSKHPATAAASAGGLTLGDYYFNVGDLERALQTYERVVATPESPDHDFARYKLAWVAVNNADCNEALRRFEEVIRSKIKRPALEAGALDIRAEALVDKVFCYSQAVAPGDPVRDFTSVPVSKAVQLRALDRLAQRYSVMDRPVDALPVYEKLRAWTTDAEQRREYEQAIGDLRARLASQRGRAP